VSLALVEDMESPHANAEAEGGLCGALMQENSLIDGIADRLSPEDFSEEFFGHLFSVIVRERSLGHTANPITLRPYFEEGARTVICQLGANSLLGVMAARNYADQIRSLAQRRRLIGGLQEAIDKAAEPTAGPDEIAAIAESALAKVAEEEAGNEEFSGADCIKRVLDGFDSPDRNGGVRSGMDALDAVLGPLRPKSLNIVAARPGMGKSALALSYALGAARNGHGVLFISLEMSADEIGERMAADLCFDSDRRVPANAISSGNLSSDQKREVARAYDRMTELPIAIVDTSAAKVGKINRLIRRHARRFAARGQKLELVIVDYLGLAKPDRSRDKTYEDVSEVSMGLKAAAKQHGVALMALHQLSRNVEQRADKRPMMADLRDSGQIEQDADSILFLFAPEYYLAQAKPTNDDAKIAEWERLMHEAAGQLDFIVAKRRRGAAGVGRGMFYRAYQAVRG
jgi:replicative DNA helicase